MSVGNELQSTVKRDLETRKILGPGGNRVRVLEEEKKKQEGLKNRKQSGKTNAAITARKSVSESTKVVVGKKGSSDICSDSSSRNGSAVKNQSLNKSVMTGSVEAAKVVPDGAEIFSLSPTVLAPVKRCDWITPNSEPLYTSFHDEEWGNPVNDERKLFELLVLSQALAELTWPTILRKRDAFRRIFDNFDPSSISSFDEKKLQSMTKNGNSLLSEQKLRAVIDNAKQVLEVQREFGSFSYYCWRFVNHRPVRNGFRYARQVPAKTPKSEHMSKDLMQRGFRCVGPTIVYSFMQVAGMVNDHLVSCYRYNECNNSAVNNLEAQLVEKIHLTDEASKSSCISHEQ